MKLLKRRPDQGERRASPQEAQGYPRNPRGEVAHSPHPDVMSMSGAAHRHQGSHKKAHEHAREMHQASGLQVTSTTGPDDGDNDLDAADAADPRRDSDNDYGNIVPNVDPNARKRRVNIDDRTRILSQGMPTPLSSGAYVNAGVYQFGH